MHHVAAAHFVEYGRCMTSLDTDEVPSISSALRWYPDHRASANAGAIQWCSLSFPSVIGPAKLFGHRCARIMYGLLDLGDKGLRGSEQVSLSHRSRSAY